MQPRSALRGALAHSGNAGLVTCPQPAQRGLIARYSVVSSPDGGGGSITCRFSITLIARVLDQAPHALSRSRWEATRSPGPAESSVPSLKGEVAGAAFTTSVDGHTAQVVALVTHEAAGLIATIDISGRPWPTWH